MDPVGLGMLLGLVNVLVIAVGMDVTADKGLGVVGLVFAYGFVPGTFTGALLGATAHKTRAWPVRLRRVVLAVPALLLVVGLAKFFACEQFMLLAFIPTVAAALCLEHRTREALPLPRAVVADRVV